MREGRAEPARVELVRTELVAALGPGAVRVDQDTKETYAKDESDTGVFLPDLVVFPSRTLEVQEVFRACQRHGVPVTPVGARTGKSGGSLPLFGGVSMSLEKMNRIREVSVEDLVAVVEPGVITAELMRAVEALGLFYPPDPNSLDSCTLGGNVAENAGGPRALKYGVTRDYVLGLEWVLPSGEALRLGRRAIKGVAGYDLVGLFVGSEGTLGVATEITVQLIPRPKHVMTALVSFPSVSSAAQAVTATLSGGVLPRTLELLDEVSLEAVGRRGVRFPQGAQAALLVEVDGNVEEGLLAELAIVGDIAERGGALETVVAQTEEQRERLWSARRVLSTALRALKPFKISEDIAVPRSRIPEVISRLKALGSEYGLVVATYGHAGDGNLHANVLFDQPSERAKVDALVAQMMRTTIEVGGTITGEHGVGYAKRAFLPLEQAPGVLALEQAIKQLLDPQSLLNPGKIFEA